MIIKDENNCAASYFVETVTQSFSGLCDEWKVQKKKHLFKIDIFCDIYVFTDTLDQFNVSLLKKVLISLKKKKKKKSY